MSAPAPAPACAASSYASSWRCWCWRSAPSCCSTWCRRRQTPSPSAPRAVIELRLRAVLLSVAIMALAAPGFSQTPLIADLSEHQIQITTGFVGTDVLLLGTVAADTQDRRRGG